jgi:Txe/YoeB family toxin of Txe-Axe toxin-antitoxin module
MALIEIDDLFLDDIEALKREDKKLAAKVWDLIADILKNTKTPLSGLGKPEAKKRSVWLLFPQNY